MNKLLSDCLAELKAQEAGNLNKIAEAPNEPATPEQQNADVLETSQAMISKIDNFMQSVQGMGSDPNQEEGAAGAGPVGDMTTGDPNNEAAAGNSSVHLEIPAGMTVKLASCDPVDSDSAIRTIISLVPSYFEE